MKNIKQINLMLQVVFLLFIGCQTKVDETAPVFQCPMKCEGEKTYSSARTCPVCQMDLEKTEHANDLIHGEEGEILETSIFNLTSNWNTQNEKKIQLKDLRGDVLVVVMIYTSCKSACPRLMADMRNIYSEVPDQSVRYVLVSIDPAVDTPQRLKKVAIENQMDSEQWIFLQGTEESVREFANVLAMKYKKISPMDFSHSNIISVFDEDGVLRYQQEGLGVSNENIVNEINQLYHR